MVASPLVVLGPRFRSALAALALAAIASAHGGQYRGPGTPGGPNPGGPGSGTPSTPGPGTPRTGAGPAIADEVSWQVWWEFNKDEFLQLGALAQTVALTGDDDFYLGRHRREAPVDMLLPTDADRRDHIVPALAALLQQESSRDVRSACAIALGKVDCEVAGFDLEQTLVGLIARGDQEVRESGVIALGIAGRARSLPMLLGLVRDDAVGRRLCDRADVGDRTRAFAAYGLGLLARKHDDSALKQQVRDALWAVLQDKEVQDRDLRTAAINGLGVLIADPESSVHKRLAWETVDLLLGWYGRDLGRGDEAVQAHVPVAIGRLLGRGDAWIHRRCKAVFAAEFQARSRRSNSILQSCALALGMLCQSHEENPQDDEFLAALRDHYLHGHDRLGRYLSAIALGRIGGLANRTWLLETHARASRSTEQPWLAIALGLVAAKAARAGEPDEALARLLLGELPGATKPEGQGALAVAIGLTGCRSMVPSLLRLLRANEQDEFLAGYFCVGLALLGDPSAAPTLIAVMERAKRRPFLLLQAAIGLGRIGDRRANDRLLAMMKATESTVVLAAVANAIGQIGDRRAIAPLIAMSRDDQLTRLARAFVAAALGGVGDRRVLPWNVPLSRDSNYAAAVDTLTNGSTGVLDIL